MRFRIGGGWKAWEPASYKPPGESQRAGFTDTVLEVRERLGVASIPGRPS